MTRIVCIIQATMSHQHHSTHDLKFDHSLKVARKGLPTFCQSSSTYCTMGLPLKLHSYTSNERLSNITLGRIQEIMSSFLGQKTKISCWVVWSTIEATFLHMAIISWVKSTYRFVVLNPLRLISGLNHKILTNKSYVIHIYNYSWISIILPFLRLTFV